MKLLTTDDLVAVGETARLLGKSSDMVRVYERTGKLAAVKIAGIRYFKRDDVNELIKKQAAKRQQTTQQD